MTMSIVVLYLAITRASYSTGLQTDWWRSRVTATVRNTLWARPVDGLSFQAVLQWGYLTAVNVVS